MANSELQLIADRLDGKQVLRVPSVGLLTEVPRQGRLLCGGAPAGVLITLGVAHVLVVPKGISGRIENKTPERVHQPVSYGEILFELTPIGADESQAEDQQGDSQSSGPVLAAPYSGRFWQRPAPSDPCFISVGDRIEAGATVGLLEVMKTFTHLTYPTDGSLPSPAKVTAVLIPDGGEVAEGEAVIEVEAL